MDETMAPPSKRRRLLDPAEGSAQESELAKTSVAPFSHRVEHIPASQPTQAPIAHSSPHHVEEVHLQIHKRSISGAEERLRLLKRQGTAALTDIINTNSNADIVVAVTANVDALGSTTALATAAVTVDVPDLSSLLSTSSTTTVISTQSSEPTSSTTPASSTESSSSERARSSEATSSSDDSRGSSAPSSTTESTTSTSRSSASQQTYAISPASENSDDDAQSQSQSSTSTRSAESGTGSSVAPASTANTTTESSNASSSTQNASLSAYTSSNSSMLASSSGTSMSASTSGYFSQTGSASSINSLNSTASASTSTSGSAVWVSVLMASSTSSSDSQITDSSSSIDLDALYLATQSNGDVTTITRSDEPFTTSLADGEVATIAPSSSGATSSPSGSVTVISSGGSTVRSTVYSTASPSSTQSSSDEPSGVGLAGVAGDGATATSSGISSTSTSTGNNGDDDATTPAGTIAGGVVGGAAGLVLVGLIILLFLRRYKKRAQLGHQALPANTAGPLAGSDGGTSSSGPGMAQRAGLMPFAGAVPALFRHQNRQSGAETGERGFQRVSGRKLPSAFSEGMAGPPHPPTSPPPTMPLVSPDDGERNLSSHSFYRDSAGFYGGDGSSTSPNPFSDTNLPAAVSRNEAAEQLIMSPGPQRRPTIHAPKSNVQVPSVATSGTPSWTPSHTATFARSDTPASLDGSRGSRFTEEV